MPLSLHSFVSAFIDDFCIKIICKQTKWLTFWPTDCYYYHQMNFECILGIPSFKERIMCNQLIMQSKNFYKLLMEKFLHVWSKQFWFWWHFSCVLSFFVFLNAWFFQFQPNKSLFYLLSCLCFQNPCLNACIWRNT